jgi:Fic family protein
MVDQALLAKYIYNSNRLDGVHIAFETTLELIQARPSSLEDTVDIPPMTGSKTFHRHHVLSHADAIDMLSRLAKERVFTQEHVQDLHRALMNGVILSNGEFRECTLRYRNIPAVPPEDIPRRVKRLLTLMNQGFERARDKVVLAWQVHHEFIFGHPFIEGNGRLARLLLNVIRMRAGLGIEVIPFGEAERYMKSIAAYGRKLAELTGQKPVGSHSQSGRLLQPPG